MSDRSLLTIELGSRCNNRCAFCPQHHLRTLCFDPGDITTRQAIKRIEAGRRAGYRSIAFTGGEPTIRPDLPDLIRRARTLEYDEIALTTNGRMFSVQELAAEVIRAGLNRVTFSLHSAKRAVHDALSGVPGAFEQLRNGIAQLSAQATAQGRGLKLHSVTLLLPETLTGVEQTVELAAEMGASIHILQPFIASRPNLSVASSYFVPIDEVAAATIRAGRRAAQLGTRVKPYNIPYCKLATLEGLELQPYRLRTHKRHQSSETSEGDFGQTQFFPMALCPTCPTPCPGFRFEHYPREKMVREIVEDVAQFRSSRLLLPGLDLLDADSIEALLAELGEKEVVPVSGGHGWCGSRDFAGAVAAGGVSRVWHLLRTDWDGGALDEPEPGNEEALLIFAAALKDAEVRNTLFVAFPDLALFSLSFDRLAEHFDEIVVAMPRFWRGCSDDAACADMLTATGPAATACAKKLASVCSVVVATFESVRILPKEAAHWQRGLMKSFPSFDCSGSMVRHRFASPQFNYLIWSNPFWLF